MILREDILSELEKELGDLLADAPANLSESALKSIQAESIGYEASILEKAFLAQKQQWVSKFKQRPLEKTANPAIAKYIRKQAATQRENPRSPITKAVLTLHSQKPDLDDNAISRTLTGSGQFSREITRNNVKRIRHSYPHLW